MKKKAIMAIILAAALVLAPISGELAVTVNAAENPAALEEEVTAAPDDAAAESVSGNDVSGDFARTTDKIKLEAPTGLQWIQNWIPVWNEVVDAKGYYLIEMEWVGENGYNTRHGWRFQNTYQEIEGIVSFDVLRREICASGSYRFRVMSLASYDPDNYEDSEYSEWSPVYNYVKPDAVLGTTACYWSDTAPGTICWSAVEGAENYEVGLYRENKKVCEMWSLSWGLSLDWSDELKLDGGKYYCTVRALSSDIEAVANGAVGEPSGYYDTEAVADPISGIISDAMENAESAAALEMIKSDIDKESLRTAMQTSDTVLNQMKSLENSYVQEQNIILNPPAVSEEAGAYVNAEDISVIGAGLNAASGQAVKLEVSVPEQKVPVNYAKSVQLDIRLIREGEYLHELDIPVMITLPVPEGLGAERLVILHYNKDGSCERVKFKLSDDGRMVTFTVSRFSTFAFAQEPDDGAEDNTSSGSDENDDNESSGNSDDDNSSAGGSDFTADVENQIRAAAKNETVKLTGITVLSNGIMKTLLERKDITLVMEYTYEGKNYTVVIPAGSAVDNDIPWYGPLYLAGYYGSGGYVAGGTSIYSVKRGDTMSRIAKINRMSLAQLAAKNPQIRNINLIRVGQKINL